MKQWYVLHTKVSKELSVASILKERGLDSYCPIIPSNNRTQTVYRPLFPSYIFLNASIGELEEARWRWIPGLHRVVSINHIPTVMPEKAIELIYKQVAIFTHQIQEVQPPFKHGDSVRITSGPFENLYAVFDQSYSPSDRVQVLMEFLGKANKVQLSAHQLERATPPTSSTYSEKRLRRTRGGGRRINYKKKDLV